VIWTILYNAQCLCETCPIFLARSALCVLWEIVCSFQASRFMFKQVKSDPGRAEDFAANCEFMGVQFTRILTMSTLANQRAKFRGSSSIFDWLWWNAARRPPRFPTSSPQ
jgi:hypothetical protein